MSRQVQLRKIVGKLIANDCFTNANEEGDITMHTHPFSDQLASHPCHSCLISKLELGTNWEHFG